MKITMYELLGMIKDGKAPKKIKYCTFTYWYDEVEKDYYRYVAKDLDDEGIEYLLESCFASDILNDEVEVCSTGLTVKEAEENLYKFSEALHKEANKKREKELHANDIEFNINNDKRDCIITLDENDLGIDKLHLDNCYFYKENDKWYIKKYDFKNFNLEEKKIPEIIHWHEENGVGNDDDAFYVDVNDKSQYVDSEYDSWEMTVILKINEIIDYLKSKGDE